MSVSQTPPQFSTEHLLDEIEHAQNIIQASESPVLPTHIFRDETLSVQYDADIWLVSELHQLIGAYKIRGAYYAIASLSDEEKAKGVITASAGNHAQGVACSAAAEGVAADIYVPSSTPDQKLEKLGELCAGSVRLMTAGDTFDEASEIAHAKQRINGKVFIEPFNHAKTLAGQGTLGRELFDALPGVEAVLMPVGGGGLGSAVATVAKDHNPDVLAVGVEPLGAASMQAAFLQGQPVTLENDFDTFVDGAAVKRVGGLTYAIASRTLDKLVAVDNNQLRRTVTDLWERPDPIRAELAGGLAVSGLAMVADQIKGKQVACIVSGGNLSRDRYEQDVKIAH